MLILLAKTREFLGKKNKILREQNLVPAVVYGRGMENQNIEIKTSVFEKIFKQAGESDLIDLKVDEKKPVKVLIQDVQIDPITENFIHIDFHQIRADEKVKVEVEIDFTGQSRAVEELGGILVKNLDTLEIECLPKDLPHRIEVDISAFDNFGNVIYIRDIKAPAGVKILNNSDDSVASIIEPRSEKELAELEEKPEEKVLPEGAEEKKEDEEEVKEGWREKKKGGEEEKGEE